MSGIANRDELICAFIDGTLAGDELAAFEAELAQDETLAADVERLMANDTLLREAFDAPMTREVDDALLARMGLGEDAASMSVIPSDLASHRQAAGVANDNPPLRTRWALPLGAAVAAALALAVVLNAPRGSGTGFGEALDATPSGEMAALDNGSELTPVLTFSAADGSFCREFSLARDGMEGGTGIACRRAGSWRVEAIERGAVELADPEQIVLATGNDGSALEGTYARLGASDPFDAERETRLIARGWMPGEE